MNNINSGKMYSMFPVERNTQTIDVFTTCTARDAKAILRFRRKAN